MGLRPGGRWAWTGEMGRSGRCGAHVAGEVAQGRWTGKERGGPEETEQELLENRGKSRELRAGRVSRRKVSQSQRLQSRVR